MTEDYTLTLEDVQTYLDTKQDNNVVGETGMARGCLLAEVLRLKYPGMTIKVGLRYLYVDGEEIPFTPELQVIRRQFDEMGQRQTITKAQWLHARRWEDDL